ncbi:uncharacterized protein PFL1_05622 [Pseudozyma flocculosa PF-1]|uniref:Serine-threonine kinase receptor-associated protein n=2 Tax=Pseudozyma flocculosa TaxID=84751 RepID=A0A5C3F9C0_9BASI|nr:uncharacterized protein PFL1_05622 [Pseudozyma flocculosa PF-1]EPQ26986.1 hypothetical protein PFL1_05622 [Pseudozyma flocculosa PF-1]SPO40686.1 related to UNR-interacting protein STRAP (serine-threonine kinase receptor-associated protein) [Pseudozyma flocculosa]
MSTPVQKSVPLTCSGHTRPVVHLEFSELQDDGTYSLLSSCKDGNPMLRDWLGDWVGTFLGHKGAVWCSKLSGGEASLAVTASADFSAKVWDTFTGSCLHTFPHNHIVRSAAINARGTRILTGGHEKKLRLFDLSRPDAEPDYLLIDGEKGTAHDGTIKSVVWHRHLDGSTGPTATATGAGAGAGAATATSNGRGTRGNGAAGASEDSVVVSAGEDRTVRWWDTRTLRKTHELKFDDPITSMERSYGSLGEILTVTSGKKVLFIDAASRTPLQTHTLPITPSSVSLHPTLGDRFVAGATEDGWVRVYDFATGQERELHKGHHGPVHCVSYSPDGELAASGSEDGTIRLWQTWPSKRYGLWT